MSVAQYESRRRKYARYALILACLIVVLFPIFWMLVSSLRPRSAMFSTNPSLIPTAITLEHYRTVINGNQFVTSFVNSIIIAVSATIVSVTFATRLRVGEV